MQTDYEQFQKNSHRTGKVEDYLKIITDVVSSKVLGGGENNCGARYFNLALSAEKVLIKRSRAIYQSEERISLCLLILMVLFSLFVLGYSGLRN